MSIQQNVNKILSLSAVFARMSPLGEMAAHEKEVKSAKEAYEQQSGVVEQIKKNKNINQIPPRENKQNEAKNLPQLEPTREQAHDINNMEADISARKEIAAKQAAAHSKKADISARKEMVAKQAAAHSMEVEKARQEADRARETRLKILEGVPLSTKSENYTKKLLESNTPTGKPLKEKEEKSDG